MKTIQLITVLLILSACQGLKKSTVQTARAATSVETSTTETTNDRAEFKNNVVVTQTTVKKTIEYYPAEEAKPETQAPGSGRNPQPDEPKKGAVKSETTQTTTTTTEDKGTAEITHSGEKKESTTGKQETEQKTTVKEKPVDVRKWMWIFGILVIVAGAFIYLKRSKVFPLIKSVLSRAGKILKI